MKLPSLAGSRPNGKRLQTLACIACRLSDVSDREEKNMEHRHIPALKDGSIPSAKTRFWRGEDNFLEEKWYGRCAICGELICPPKHWNWLQRYGWILLFTPYIIAMIILSINVTSETAGWLYLFIVSGFAVLMVILRLLLNAYLAFGKWQPFPEGPEAKQLLQRTDRKSEKAWWLRVLILWIILSVWVLLCLSALIMSQCR